MHTVAVLSQVADISPLCHSFCESSVPIYMTCCFWKTSVVNQILNVLCAPRLLSKCSGYFHSGTLHVQANYYTCIHECNVALLLTVIKVMCLKCTQLHVLQKFPVHVTCTCIMVADVTYMYLSLVHNMSLRCILASRNARTDSIPVFALCLCLT